MTEEMFIFLDRLVSLDGFARRVDLPLATRAQDKARTRCKKLGYAHFVAPYWRITLDGRGVLAEEISNRAGSVA